MTLILLLLHLTTFVCGKSTEKTTLHQAEEDDDVTFRWDSQNQTDMSLTNMICFLLSKPLKVLYELIDGVELPESQHQQFSGRVQCDGDALREGRLRLHLSRLTTGDSGTYRCDLAANYDQNFRRWELQAKLHFVLNVTQTSHGASFMSLSTTKSGLTPVEGVGQPAEVVISTTLASVAVGVVLILYVAVTVFRGKKQKDKQKKDAALVELQIKTSNTNQLQHSDSTEQDALKTFPDI